MELPGAQGGKEPIGLEGFSPEAKHYEQEALQFSLTPSAQGNTGNARCDTAPAP